jgi:hypothetical protein
MANRYGDFYAFERNKLYSIKPSILVRGGRKADVFKYITTEYSPGRMPLMHIFTLPEDPDSNEPGSRPAYPIYISDFDLNYPRRYRQTIVSIKKHHAEKAAEIGTMTGTRAQGPATAQGQTPRKEADVVLPRDVTRHIAEFAGQGRRRKTRRTRRS